jgi:hypothetical protein
VLKKWISRKLMLADFRGADQPAASTAPFRDIAILLTATASYYSLEKPCIELGKRVSKNTAARSKRSQPIQITSNDLVMAAQQPNPAKMID